ncbi:very short patch repair endonuclease [Teredinibacter turnerae]|uniref:very short patch repair endonuclease n=1 Tax=Teredinibacter turnerae TaxID=2426 RepID=UPI00056CE5CD|nr:very short patch repair endonuclease [Teredinibacter turnerae]
MADVLTKEQRSYCMSQIRGKNTKPEVILRKALWSMGHRYRIKNKLPGKPDLVYPSLKVVIFVDGCFWHKCPKHYQPPKTHQIFWENKINANVERDKKNDMLLTTKGWIIVRIWEHEIKESLYDCTQKISKLLTNRKSHI